MMQEKVIRPDQNGDKSMMLEKGLEKDKIEAEALSEKMKRY